MAGEINNALNLKKETCEITVRCLSTQSLETFSSVPGQFETIMQMTVEMMVQAMQDKVHLPLQILLKNEQGEEDIYDVRTSWIKQGMTLGTLSFFNGKIPVFKLCASVAGRQHKNQSSPG
mgnify:CR=1 FL=1